MHERASRTGDGFFLVYSVASRDSLNNLLPFYDLIKRYNKDANNVPVILVGNKCDLKEERQVTFEEGQALAQELKCRFYETSAKLAIRVEEAYMDLARQTLIHIRERAAREFSSPAKRVRQNNGWICASVCSVFLVARGPCTVLSRPPRRGV
ncbi:P-loop containing nucleoside triphosphate hydrolase protein [Cristinia sonorae]|uniref:P-loop containing nucleoside triphosphate hydrolase protein n=1 Tax=Cristinia sonorae TaxID=1940300 RepID=A0A8K0UQ98_9AGAR|nr:P-loop containing nucleoside triphosphate hydrolase protein [Cristinia sonorae]